MPFLSFHRVACTIALVVGLGTVSDADIVFDFTGGGASTHFADLDDMNSGTTMSAGVSLTATANGPAGPGGELAELNFHSGDGLGVNVVNDGGDESNKLDAGLGTESIDFVFGGSVDGLSEVHIDGMGWDSDADYEYADLLINNVYFATLLDTDADLATQAQHANPIVGASSDTFLNLGISFSAGDTITLEYGEVGSNNGWRIEQLTAIPEPGSLILTLGFATGLVCVRRR